MNSKNEIDRLAWKLVSHVRDTVSQNVTAAVQRGDLKIENAVLGQLVSLLNASVDEAGSRALRDFDRQIQQYLVG